MKSNADDLVIKTNERVRWTEELHEIFVAAALKLGPKAVPSKVLAEMKCTVLTRDQVASHLQNYRPILFGKEEDSAKTKQQAPTKKVERKKRAPEPAKESAKEAPKKKQRAMAVSPQEVKPAPVPSKASPQPKQPPVISVNKPENPAVAAPAPVITPTPAPIESVEKQIPVKNEPTLSMSNEANDRLIEQFFGDFDLIGVDFGSDESPVNDGSGNNDIRQPASEETQPAFVDGRLAGFEIIEDEEGYPSPQSDCSFVCNSPPVVQSSPSEASVFAFDWNSPEFQLGEFEIGAPSTDEVQLLSNASDFDQDHSCWYCNSYNSITSLI